MASLATPLAPIPPLRRPRRSSLTKQPSPSSTNRRPRVQKANSSTTDLSKMARVINIWRGRCLDVKNTDRRVQRSASLKLHRPRVGFHPPTTPLQTDDEYALIHDVHVEEMEFDPEEAVLTLRDDSFVTQDYDEIPWYEQEYEELPWWEYPDLDEDDEITAMCKDVIRDSLHTGGIDCNTSVNWEQKHADRVEALVMSFVLKLKNRVAFTQLQKQQMQAAVQSEFDEVSLNSSLANSVKLDDVSLNSSVKGGSVVNSVNGASVTSEISKRSSITSLSSATDKEEQFQQMKQQQILNLQQDQEEKMQQLLSPSPKANKITRDDVAKMVLPRRNRPTRKLPRRTRSGNSQQSHSVLDDDSVSLHSAVLSTGWNRLNIHNSEMRRYQKNHRKGRRRSGTARGLWADDHTVMVNSGGAADDDDVKSVASFQSSPAMMEYTKTRQSWMSFNPNRRRREPKKVFKLTTSATSTISPSENDSMNAPPVTKRKKKKKKKKKVGHLALFMAKEELKGDSDSGNIFDIMEEENEDLPASSFHEENEPPKKASLAAMEREELTLNDNTNDNPLVDDSDKEESSHSFHDDANDEDAHKKQEDRSSNGTAPTEKSSIRAEESNRAEKEILQPATEAPNSEQKVDSNAVMDEWVKAVGAIKKTKPSYDPTKEETQSRTNGCKILANDKTATSSSAAPKIQSTPSAVVPSTGAAKTSEPGPKAAFRKKVARRASGSGLGTSIFSSMQRFPDSGPRSNGPTAGSTKQDDSKIDDSSKKDVPKKSNNKRTPFLARAASFSEIQFSVPDDENNNTKSPRRTPTQKEDPKLRLVMLRHAAMCTQNQRGCVCPSDPKCSQMKELLRHMTRCKHESIVVPCNYPGCHESKRFLLIMHKTSQILARQQEKEREEKKLPPVVAIPMDSSHHSVGAKNSSHSAGVYSVAGDDDLSDIGSFGSAGDGSDDDSSKDSEANPSKKQSLNSRSHHVDGTTAREKDLAARHEMQRRPSWAGSLAMRGPDTKPILKDRALEEKILKEKEEREKIQEDLKRRHEAVKARVQAKLQKAKREKEELDAKVSEAEKRTQEQAAIMQKRRSQISLVVEKEPTIPNTKNSSRNNSKRDLLAQKNASTAIGKQSTSEVKNSSQTEEKEQAEPLRKHEELKAKSKVEKTEKEAAKNQRVAKTKRHVRRKSMPANPVRPCVAPKRASTASPASTTTRLATKKLPSNGRRSPTPTNVQKTTEQSRLVSKATEEKCKVEEQKCCTGSTPPKEPKQAIHVSSVSRPVAKQVAQVKDKPVKAVKSTRKSQTNQTADSTTGATKSTTNGKKLTGEVKNTGKKLTSEKVYEMTIEATSEVERLKAAKLAKRAKRDKKRALMLAANK